MKVSYGLPYGTFPIQKQLTNELGNVITQIRTKSHEHFLPYTE